MLFVLGLIVRALARLLRVGARDDGAEDLEILVLRHQLRVLQRRNGPPRFRAVDRVLLAMASRSIPRARWVSFIVTPATLLRWHRELVRRKVDVRQGGPARSATAPSRGAGAHPSACPGEPALGLRAPAG